MCVGGRRDGWGHLAHEQDLTKVAEICRAPKPFSIHSTRLIGTSPHDTRSLVYP